MSVQSGQEHQYRSGFAVVLISSLLGLDQVRLAPRVRVRCHAPCALSGTSPGGSPAVSAEGGHSAKACRSARPTFIIVGLDSAPRSATIWSR